MSGKTRPFGVTAPSPLFDPPLSPFIPPPPTPTPIPSPHTGCSTCIVHMAALGIWFLHPICRAVGHGCFTWMQSAQWPRANKCCAINIQTEALAGPTLQRDVHVQKLSEGKRCVSWLCMIDKVVCVCVCVLGFCWIFHVNFWQ